MNGEGFKSSSVRDDKNIDSIENAKEGHKWGIIFLPSLLYEGVKKLSFLMWGCQKKSKSLRGRFKIFLISFWIRPPYYCWFVNDQPLHSYNFRYTYFMSENFLVIVWDCLWNLYFAVHRCWSYWQNSSKELCFTNFLLHGPLWVSAN